MNLKEISYAMRAVGELARAGERLFDTLSVSRRLTLWPVVLGVGVGIGIGALIFDDDARKRVKAWLDAARIDVGPASSSAPRATAAEPRDRAAHPS